MDLHTNIVDMMEQHFCAHPLIPGYLAPSPEGIKEWAVGELVSSGEMGVVGKVCRHQDSSVENVHSWQHIKKDFLHHFHKPRLDHPYGEASANVLLKT